MLVYPPRGDFQVGRVVVQAVPVLVVHVLVPSEGPPQHLGHHVPMGLHVPRSIPYFSLPCKALLAALAIRLFVSRFVDGRWHRLGGLTRSEQATLRVGESAGGG